MRKIKNIGLSIIVLLSILFLMKSPIKNYLDNINTSYIKYVYLGGNDITIYINNNTSIMGNAVTSNSFNAISGILTYIDYDNNTYGAIAHNIIEKEAPIDGEVYASTVIEIQKSITSIGNKTTTADTNNKYGTVEYASNTGVYGTYSSTNKDKIPMQIAMPKEVELGTAYIVTSINNEIKKYEIKITGINMFRKDKNITFKIVDENLINETGGIIKGMSGSPIIQNGKLIGALSHSYNDDFKKGNAIFITNMIK